MNSYQQNNGKIFYLLFGVFFLLGFVLTYQNNRLQTTHTACRGCNVVMISLDLVRADQLPCYGYRHNTMPRLCQFAKSHIQFTNAHSQSTRTLPNETSIFTSLYESNHGIYNIAIDTLHPSIKTLTEFYKDAGYQTIFVGTEVEGNIPLFGTIRKSFDEVKILHPTNTEEEFQEWIRALQRIENRKKTDPPIFLYIYSGYMQQYHQEDLFTVKHFPLDPTFQIPQIPELFTFHPQTVTNAKETLRYNIYNSIGKLSTDAYKNILTKLESNITLSQKKQAFEMLPALEQRGIYYHEVNDILDATNTTHRRYMQNLYDARLSDLDTRIAPFLDRLDSPPTQNDTIVALYSDHGESLGENGLFGHSKTPYNVVTHVPLVMHVPKIASQTYTPIIQLVDLMPTLLSLTGIHKPKQIVGSDISGLFWGQPLVYPAGTFAISQKPGAEITSIKTDTWRLIIHNEATKPAYTELYNVTKDPTESINVASVYKNIVAKLTSQLNNTINVAPIYPHVERAINDTSKNP